MSRSHTAPLIIIGLIIVATAFVLFGKDDNGFNAAKSRDSASETQHRAQTIDGSDAPSQLVPSPNVQPPVARSPAAPSPGAPPPDAASPATPSPVDDLPATPQHATTEELSESTLAPSSVVVAAPPTVHKMPGSVKNEATPDDLDTRIAYGDVPVPAPGSEQKRPVEAVDPAIPEGYSHSACIPKHRYNASRFEESISSSKTATENDKCLNIPGLRPEIKAKMMEQVKQWSHQFNIQGTRVLAWIGRQYSAEVVIRAVRSMLKDRGGAADFVVLQFRAKQKHYLQPIINEMKFPPGSLSVVVKKYSKKNSGWDFRDQYDTVIDGHLHIKVDDDLFYFQPNFELYLIHRYLSQRYLAWASDLCEHNGNCSKQGREVSYGWRSKHSVCSVLSANVVNHVGLTSVHTSMGALNQLEPQLEWDFQSIRPISRWASLHRSLLRPIAEGRNPLEVFDFGLHHFDCDAQPRRWSINCVLFSFDSIVAKKMLSDDEDFMSFQHGRLLRFMEDKPYPVRSCADGRALTIHASYSGQYTFGVHYPRLSNRENILLNAIERLRPYYVAIAQHLDGTKKCCKSNGCIIFDEAAQDEENEGSILCKQREKCTFPFTKDEGYFAALENWTYVDGDTPVSGVWFGLAIRPEMTSWIKLWDSEKGDGSASYLATDTENTASDKFFGLEDAKATSSSSNGAQKQYIIKSLAVRGSCLFRADAPLDASSSFSRTKIGQWPSSMTETAAALKVWRVVVKKCPVTMSDVPPEALWSVSISPNGTPWYRLQQAASSSSSDAAGEASSQPLFLSVLPSGRVALLNAEVSDENWGSSFRSIGGRRTSPWQDFRLLDAARFK